MNTNPLKQGVLTENSAGIGTVTREMVRERAIELAVINGRAARDVSKSDLDQAKRELTGEPDSSEGHKLLAAPSADEDEEGRSDNERLVEEGIAGAEHDQMLQAARDTAKKDK